MHGYAPTRASLDSLVGGRNARLIVLVGNKADLPAYFVHRLHDLHSLSQRHTCTLDVTST
jgi:hypothetical protein